MIKRNRPRFNATFNAGFGALNTGMLLPCTIVDISWGGTRIELFAKHTVTANSTIELHIEVPGLKRRIVASFRCMWSRPVDRTGNEDGNIIGGCFIGMSPEDRALLLDHAKKQTQKDAVQPHTCKLNAPPHYQYS